MKKVILLLISFCFLVPKISLTQEVTNFSDWSLWICKPDGQCEPYQGATSGSFGVSGSDWSVDLNIQNGKLTFTINGSDKGGIWVGLGKNFYNDAWAFIANYKINSVNGNAYAGIWHSIEEWPIAGIEEDELTCEIKIQQWDGCRGFLWRVRERSDDRSYEKRLSCGQFGDYCNQWNLNENKFLGYGMINNEMLFWVDGYKSIHKFIPIIPFSSSINDFDPTIEIYVDQGGQNSITVEVSSIQVF